MSRLVPFPARSDDARAFLAAIVVLAAYGSFAERISAAEPDHRDLSYWIDDSGRQRPVQTREDWANRRADVIRRAERVMGPLPRPATPVPLEAETRDESRLDGGMLIRRKVRYHTDREDEWVSAWLFLPAGDTPRAAVLCLHQTVAMGKDEPAGLAGRADLHYAVELARRGFITLAPDYPSFGEHACDFESVRGYASGTMQAIYDNIRAVDLLQSLSEVSPSRIGCIGHSLGGHNAIFTAVFEPRIRAVVSNCGYTRFHKYYEGRLQGWTSPRYMPRIAAVYHNSPDEVPFDFPELVACLAPRAFLSIAPLHDENFEVSGVRDCVAAAQPVFELHEAGKCLQARYPDCGHEFPEAERREAYRFLERELVDP